MQKCPQVRVPRLVVSVTDRQTASSLTPGVCAEPCDSRRPSQWLGEGAQPRGRYLSSVLSRRDSLCPDPSILCLRLFLSEATKVVTRLTTVLGGLLTTAYGGLGSVVLM